MSRRLHIGKLGEDIGTLSRGTTEIILRWPTIKRPNRNFTHAISACRRTDGPCRPDSWRWSAPAAAIAGVRSGQFGFATGQLVMIPATALALAALVCGLAWLKSAIARNEGTARRTGLVALIGALLFLYPVGGYVLQGWTGLHLSDVTTAPEDAPQFVALAKLRQPGQNALAFDAGRKISFQGEQVTAAYALHMWKNGEITHPHTKLLPSAADPKATVFWRCYKAVDALGWQRVDFSEKDGRIEAVATSFWFAQPADVVVRVRPAGYLAARYDVRAQSREGADDHGFALGLVRAFKDKADR